MSERHLYGSDGQHVGSIDDDNRIYDDRHSFMGRIENGTIYDNCNIPQGRIRVYDKKVTLSGKVAHAAVRAAALNEERLREA